MVENSRVSTLGSEIEFPLKDMTMSASNIRRLQQHLEIVKCRFNVLTIKTLSETNTQVDPARKNSEENEKKDLKRLIDQIEDKILTVKLNLKD